MAHRTLERHMGRHQEKLALFAVPPQFIPGVDENEGTDSDEDLNQIGEGDEGLEVYVPETSMSSELLVPYAADMHSGKEYIYGNKAADRGGKIDTLGGAAGKRKVPLTPESSEPYSRSSWEQSKQARNRHRSSSDDGHINATPAGWVKDEIPSDGLDRTVILDFTQQQFGQKGYFGEEAFDIEEASDLEVCTPWGPQPLEFFKNWTF